MRQPSRLTPVPCRKWRFNPTSHVTNHIMSYLYCHWNYIWMCYLSLWEWSIYFEMTVGESQITLTKSMSLYLKTSLLQWLKTCDRCLRKKYLHTRAKSERLLDPNKTLWLVADSLHGMTLMPHSVLQWTHQLLGLRLIQLSQVPCGEAMEQKGQRPPAFRDEKENRWWRGEGNSLQWFSEGRGGFWWVL